MAYYRLQPRVPFNGLGRNPMTHWVNTDHQDLDYERLRLELAYDAEIRVERVARRDFGGRMTRIGKQNRCIRLETKV